MKMGKVLVSTLLMGMASMVGTVGLLPERLKLVNGKHTANAKDFTPKPINHEPSNFKPKRKPRKHNKKKKGY